MEIHVKTFLNGHLFFYRHSNTIYICTYFIRIAVSNILIDDVTNKVTHRTFTAYIKLKYYAASQI